MNCEFLLNDMLIESVGSSEPQVKTKPVNSGLFISILSFSGRLECIDFSFVGESTLDAGKRPGGGGYCHIVVIQVCAAVKGMVFTQFTLA